MATRAQRLADFDGQGDPPAEQLLDALCEDKSGTYQLPFVCRYDAGQWVNDETGQLLDARVIAWRIARQ